jgi:cobalt/nickel transport system permease protein
MKSLQEMKELEILADRDTFIHRLNPITKIITTMVYIIVVVSCGQLQWPLLLTLFIYPYFMMLLAEIPYRTLGKRVLRTLPFIIFLGIFQPFLNTEPYHLYGNIVVREGVVSLMTLVLKCILTVSAVLILTATTSIQDLGAGLRNLRIPDLFVTQVELLYRYISVLGEEIGNVFNAYHLRAGRRRGVSIQHSGTFLASILLRSYERSKRIYDAMCCKGYRSRIYYQKNKALNKSDYLYIILVSGVMIATRILDLPVLIGRIFV